VTCDGAEWIRTVVAERAKGATICLDTFHLIGWATDALDDVRSGNDGVKWPHRDGQNWPHLRTQL
jgi:transposase